MGSGGAGRCLWRDIQWVPTSAEAHLPLHRGALQEPTEQVLREHHHLMGTEKNTRVSALALVEEMALVRS